MKTKYLYLNSRDEFYRIDVSRIVYFEAEGNYTHFHLANNLKGTVCINLSGIQRLLSESLRDDASRFARIGKSYIVNLAYVYHLAMQRQKLTLSDGATFGVQLPVSKKALRSLRLMYTQHLSPRSPGTAEPVADGTQA